MSNEVTSKPFYREDPFANEKIAINFRINTSIIQHAVKTSGVMPD